MSRYRKDLGARAFFGAVLAVPCRTLEDDTGHVGQCFDIVDDGRFAVQTGNRWEWWLEAGLADFAFK